VNLTFRDYQPEDEQLICSLFNTVFKQNMTREFWNWRYSNNPFGNKKISLCFDQDQLVGHYAVSPIEFISNDQIFRAAHSMTTMIHPDYQGQGLFTKLATHQYDLLKQQNYDFVWGFPNRNSYYGFIKNLNWMPVMELPFLKCQDGEETLKSDLRSSETAPPKTEFDSFLQQQNSATLGLHRNSNYLQWRYNDNPVNKYQTTFFYSGTVLVGVLITKSYTTAQGTFKDILELITIDSNVTKQILAWTRYTFLYLEKVTGLYAWRCLFDRDYLMYFQNKFVPQAPLTYLGVLPLNNKTQSIVQSTKWTLSMGDSDVF
jgi:predicted N-acetyltransferase YhbS